MYFMYNHRRGNLLGIMLKALGESFGAFSWPLEYSNEWRYQQISKEFRSSKSCYNKIWQMKKQGFVTVAEQKGHKFLKLTKKGELKLLLQKASIVKTQKWDGKWRVAIFDIPENAKEQRQCLRRLLYENGFKKLQASVYINPYSLNQAAIDYLKSSGLMEFIRIMRVDKLDNDEELKKKFRL